MSLKSRRALGFGLALIAGFGYAGCAASGNDAPIKVDPSDAGSNSRMSEAGASGDKGSESAKPEGSGSGGAPSINTDVNAAGAGGEPEPATCAADVSKAEVIPLDMYIMLDVSTSMLDDTSTYDEKGEPISKWVAVKTALEAFITNDSSAGLGVGLQYFPQLKPDIPDTCTTNADCGTAAPCAFYACYTTGNACITQSDCPGGAFYNPCLRIGSCGKSLCAFVNDINPECALENNKYLACNPITTSICANTSKCDVASYAEPAQPIAPLPGAASSLVASIEANTPGKLSGTPTGPALNGAVKLAGTWAKDHPGRQVVAVLVTDGLPGECLPTSTADLARIAANALTATPPVNTFAIGVFSGDAEAQGKATLDKIALSGGTKQAFVVNTSNDVVSQFSEALKSVRSARLACRFQIPQPKTGKNIDYKQINVNFKANKKSSTLFYVGSIEKCDALKGGWYYDTNPADGNPSEILVCPTTCSTFQAATDASVDIAVGCETMVK